MISFHHSALLLFFAWAITHLHAEETYTFRHEHRASAENPQELFEMEKVMQALISHLEGSVNTAMKKPLAEVLTENGVQNNPKTLSRAAHFLIADWIVKQLAESKEAKDTELIRKLNRVVYGGLTPADKAVEPKDMEKLKKLMAVNMPPLPKEIFEAFTTPSLEKSKALIEKFLPAPKKPEPVAEPAKKTNE